MVTFSESVSTGVWCVPGFGAGFEITFKPSNCRKKEKIMEKGAFISLPNSGMHQTLVQRDLAFGFF